ncbi:hypothetical protein ACCO45_010345 [Purpureocillium lilacinum]|uniref:Uncharacterized protein n=1 Tax=Purpureocillium lilacinum TaxID=33203 RepID=A0ACC4DG16_PURLI
MVPAANDNHQFKRIVLTLCICQLRHARLAPPPVSVLRASYIPSRQSNRPLPLAVNPGLDSLRQSFAQPLRYPLPASLGHYSQASSRLILSPAAENEHFGELAESQKRDRDPCWGKADATRQDHAPSATCKLP